MSFILVLNLIALYSFVVIKKHLHFFEIMVYWMTLSFLRQDFNAVLTLNLGVVTVSQKLSMYWSIFFDRLILFTLPQVWFLSEYCVARSLTRKIILFVGCTALLTGLEGLTERLGLIHFTNWKIWWSSLFWMASMVFGVGLMKWFRKLLYAEVKC